MGGGVCNGNRNGRMLFPTVSFNSSLAARVMENRADEN